MLSGQREMVKLCDDLSENGEDLCGRIERTLSLGLSYIFVG